MKSTNWIFVLVSLLVIIGHAQVQGQKTEILLSELQLTASGVSPVIRSTAATELGRTEEGSA